MGAPPLHTGVINGHPVRFFKKPTGAPDLPWHAVDDLYRALGLNREIRRDLLRTTQGSWSTELRTIATADGVVTIAPHPVAQGLIGAMIETGRAPAALEADYIAAGAAALKAMAGDLPPIASFEFALAAFRNTDAGGAE